MLKRVVSKYDKKPPHLQVDEYKLSCTVHAMRDLFDTKDDPDMIFVYPIKTEEQRDFFREKNIPVDDKDGFFYVECYEE